MEKKFNKWYEKIRKGVEGYEGISYEKERLLHMAESHEAELDLVKIKIRKSDNQVEEAIWSMGSDVKKMNQIRLFIKNFEEMLLSTDAGKKIHYFGDNAKLSDKSSEINEIIIYIQGAHGVFLIRAKKGEKMQYLADLAGGKSTFMHDIYEKTLEVKAV